MCCIKISIAGWLNHIKDDNKLYVDKIGWQPSQLLHTGIVKTYEWINKQLEASLVPMSTADLDMRDRFQSWMNYKNY